MGKIKTTLIKRTGIELFKKHKTLFTADFQKNKEAIETVADIPSKKLRNIIAGYITRLSRQNKE